MAPTAPPSRLHVLRKEAEWTVLELAIAAGVDPRTISRIESEGQDPTLATARRIVKALSVRLRQKLTIEAVFPAREGVA